MSAVRNIRGRNVKGYVVVDASLLIAPGGQISNFQNRLAQLIRARTAAAAPTNKRPHWAYHGETRLRNSFRVSSSKPDLVRMQVTSAVGSTVDYALFVDQGTAGQAAKFLPPWKAGGYPYLFEASWRPKPWSRPVGPIHVKGQEARHFFDRGVRDGMHAVGLSSRPGAGDAVDATVNMILPKISLGFESSYSKAMFDEYRRTWRDERAAMHKEELQKWNQSGGRGARRKYLRDKAREVEKTARDRISAREAQRKRSRQIEDATKKREADQKADLLAKERAKARASRARAVRDYNQRAKNRAETLFQKLHRSGASVSIGEYHADGDGRIDWWVEYSYPGGETYERRVTG